MCILLYCFISKRIKWKVWLKEQARGCLLCRITVFIHPSSALEYSTRSTVFDEWKGKSTVGGAKVDCHHNNVWWLRWIQWVFKTIHSKENINAVLLCRLFLYLIVKSPNSLIVISPNSCRNHRYYFRTTGPTDGSSINARTTRPGAMSDAWRPFAFRQSWIKCNNIMHACCLRN